MSSGNDSPPVIHKKKKKSHGGHHGGAWKVAYADFVTAMMALFIVLWVLGQSEEVKEAVAGYFKDPVGFSSGSINVLEGKQNVVVDLDMQNEAMMRENEKKELAKMGEEILQELSESDEFQEMLDQIQIEVVDEGLRIEMVESADDVFFEIGTSQLKSNAYNLLQKIGTQISRKKNKIIVEGHTDARPYSGDGTGYTNFELSTERANSARRALTSGGIMEEQIHEVRGFADKKLRDKNDPYSAINRRISIILKFTEKK